MYSAAVEKSLYYFLASEEAEGHSVTYLHGTF